MKIKRRFTEAGKDVYSAIEWTTRSSRIVNPDGSVVFEMNDAEVPKSWSQLATDIVVSKYFRKAGVPQTADGVDPITAQREGDFKRDENGNVITGPERSVRQVVHRLAGCWRHWGQEHGYFDSAEDGQAFYDEIAHMLLNQMCAPNSPQWFNTGLNWAYGMTGPAQGHWVTDPATGQTTLADDAYSHPQPHACFIQSIEDDLVNEGGIMDLWVREARLFKYGSGTGTNFSQLRAENESLSGGGKSSGLMSWLKIGDRAAGAIKSGGTTRRAAKMVCLDLDHPDIESFTNWKVREEIKVSALVEGIKALKDRKASKNDRETIGETAARLGLDLDYDFNGEAYQTVSGQNSNNSVRIPNRFFNTLDDDGQWDLTARTTGDVTKTLRAKDLWDQIGYAAWRCADPGVQFDSTVNEWHTCPESGRINASNPCSEYMFLDNTACNLASLNLMKFYDSQTRAFDLEGFEHGIKLWTMVLEISVLMAAFPSKEIARLSYEYRTLGLGYANIGAMLMQAGIPYHSERARAICGAITAILTGRSYATSAQMAGELGPFPGYFKNKDAMLRVMRNHRRAAYGVPRDKDEAAHHNLEPYEGLEIPPVPIDASQLDGKIEHEDDAHIGTLSNSVDLLQRARSAWDDALKEGNQHGYRNAQSTVIAPTGTIGLLMDCDTTGVEPDFALVKFKKLAGGGYFKIANQSLKPALVALGYTEKQVHDIMVYVMGSLNLEVPMPDEHGNVTEATTETFADFLREAGLNDDDLAKVTDGLTGAMELGFALNGFTLGGEALQRLGLTDQQDVLRGLALTAAQIEKLNELVCGTGTVEGAPHLRDEHLPVFDCANQCGKKGKRFIAVDGHIRMMAAAQPFISGAISKTINLPNDASVEDIKQSYRLSWELCLKANALYRDGCKLSQPLNASADDDVEDEDAVEAGKEEVAEAVADAASRIASESDEHAVETVIKERIVEVPMRRRLPDTRRSLTHKFNVAGHEGYLTVGLYEDGLPGELFITMAKEGSTIGGLMDSLGTAISVALQYGVPVDSLVSKFTHQRFEPAGMTHNPDIPFAKSLVDYIFRWMGMEFVEGYRAANAPQRTKKEKDESAEPVRDTSAAAKKVETVVKTGTGEVVKWERAKPQAAGGNGASIVDAPRVSGNGNGGGGSSDSGGSGSSGGGGVTLKVAVGGAQVGVAAKAEIQTDGDSGEVSVQAAGMAKAMRDAQTDSPACDVCGTITVRSGTCYKCLNCGNSMGCS